MTRPEQPGRPVPEETRCPPCHLGEHKYCDGNVDLPAPVPGGIPVPLLRCTCRCPRPETG